MCAGLLLEPSLGLFSLPEWAQSSELVLASENLPFINSSQEAISTIIPAFGVGYATKYADQMPLLADTLRYPTVVWSL